MGISLDTVEQAKAFRESLKAPFPFLSDANGEVAKKYGVLADTGSARYAKRVTFVVGGDRKILHVERDRLDTEGALGACPLDNTKKTKKKKKW